MDWGELSDISQVYGGLGVLFSGAALIGVTVSIRQQNVQARFALTEDQRATHREMIFQVLGDPDLIPCLEPLNAGQNEVRWKQLLFTNLLLATWRTDFVLGRFKDDALRVFLELHFKGEVARHHWQISRAAWTAFGLAEGNAEERFVLLVDEEYSRAVHSGPPTPATAYVAHRGGAGSGP